MKTKYFVDQSGRYIGGFAGAEPPVGAIEVPTPPRDARDTYNGTEWVKSVVEEVPAKVTRRQARQALLLADKLHLVEPAIAAAIADPIARGMAMIEWQDAQEFERQHSMVLGIGEALELTDAQVDALFIQAGKL